MHARYIPLFCFKLLLKKGGRFRIKARNEQQFFKLSFVSCRVIEKNKRRWKIIGGKGREILISHLSFSFTRTIIVESSAQINNIRRISLSYRSIYISLVYNQFTWVGRDARTRIDIGSASVRKPTLPSNSPRTVNHAGYEGTGVPSIFSISLFADFLRSPPPSPFFSSSLLSTLGYAGRKFNFVFSLLFFFPPDASTR